MTRSVEEWIGKTPDTPIPPRVRLRVFEKHNGICYLSGRKILAGDLWDIEHIVALVNGGENRESNLAPALRDKHKEKTSIDVKEKSKVRSKRMKHLGIRRKKRSIPGRKFDGTPVPSRWKS